MFEENNNNQNGFDNGFQPLDSNGFNGENQNPNFAQGSGPNDDGAYRYSWTPNGENNDTGSNFHVNPAPKPPKKKGASRVAALVLCCALVGGGAGLGGAALYDRLGGGSSDGTTIYQNTTQGTQVNVQQADGLKEMSLEEIYASYADSCVNVTCQVVVQQGWQQYTGTTSGSGFILSEDGYIVTNYHIIGGANAIKVTLNNGQEYDATLIGGEETNDVAVLKIDVSGLTPVVLGDSDAINVGEDVYAIGNPLGELTFTFTGGYVSAKDRSVTMSDGTVMNMLQTDTAINSGNSGGPLFNEYGQVIGIVSAKLSSSSSSEASVEGLGFAIPINDVRDMITSIIENGYVTGKPSMGILLDDVPQAAQQYGVPAGAEVLAILDGSGADNGGLQVGDIITAVNGTEVSGSSDLQSAVSEFSAGDTVTLSIYRSGETTTVDVTLDEENQEREEAMNQLQQDYYEEQQAQQQQQQQQGGYFQWPFGW